MGKASEMRKKGRIPGVCQICEELCVLSKDHVPPSGGVELTDVEIERVFFNLTGDNSRKVLSQKGLSYTTICGQCNSLLGEKYDRALNEFALSVGRYLKTDLKLPETIHHRVKPQRVMKSVIGHLLASKETHENSQFDVLMRAYVLEPDMPLPEEINVFYWVYPYRNQRVLREFAKCTIFGDSHSLEVMQLLKYFPIAYLCSYSGEYKNLPTLSQYRNATLDEEFEVPIHLVENRSSRLAGGHSGWQRVPIPWAKRFRSRECFPSKRSAVNGCFLWRVDSRKNRETMLFLA